MPTALEAELELLLQGLPDLVLARAGAFPAPAWLRTELLAVAGRPESSRRARKHFERLLKAAALENQCDLEALALDALTSLAGQVTHRAVAATVGDILGDLLFHGHCRAIAARVVRCLGLPQQHHTLVDLADHTFMRLYELLEAGKVPAAILEDEQQLGPWLFTVCRNLARDDLRVCKRQQLPTLPEAVVPEIPDASERWFQHDETLTFFLEVCTDDVDRQIVALKAQERSFREIGESLGISEYLARKRFLQIQARARSRWERL